MMNRLQKTFEALQREEEEQQQQRCGVIPFIVAGDPDLETSAAVLRALAAAGAAAIEIGVPFSDPVADGVTIQAAAERALRRGVTLRDVLALIAEVRPQIATPLVLFSYFNPLLRYGLANFARSAQASGVDAVLITDLPPEEADEFAAVLQAHSIDLIFLVAPTTTAARLELIAQRARGFIYAVSRAGVTGARSALSAEAATLVKRVRAVSALPVAVGFGVTTPAHVAEIALYADAAVVGSALVAEINELNKIYAARDDRARLIAASIGEKVAALIAAEARTQ